MPIIRGLVRSLPIEEIGWLTAMNREWAPILRGLVIAVNRRMGVFRTLSEDTTLALDDQYLFVNATASVTLTLPPAADSCMRITVKRLSASHNVVVSPPSGEELEGAEASITLSNQYDASDFISDGTAWWRIGCCIATEV